MNELLDREARLNAQISAGRRRTAAGIVVAALAAMNLAGCARSEGSVALSSSARAITSVAQRSPSLQASDMIAPRSDHSATLLPSGKVLVVGGFAALSIASAEIFDPASGTWQPAGSLATSRNGHTATLLRSGKVLVTGGISWPPWNPCIGTPPPSDCDEFYEPTYLASVEIYDPQTGSWSAGTSLHAPRAGHTATLLPSGMVLIAGGNGPYQPDEWWDGNLRNAELYDPEADSWTTTGSLVIGRGGHTQTLLPSGKVLIAGGYEARFDQGMGNWGTRLADAEIYDPTTGVWKTTGSMLTARDAHTATLLPSGKVLVAGGLGAVAPCWGGFCSPPLDAVELYDPETESWTAASALLAKGASSAATLLPSGRLLISGGTDTYGGEPGGELFDPATGAWTRVAFPTSYRFAHTATLLPSGEVLVLGGRGFQGSQIGYLGTAEVFKDEVGGAPALPTPTITSAPASIAAGETLPLGGTSFASPLEGSSGTTQSSPVNYPLVRIRNTETGATSFEHVIARQEASLHVDVPRDLPPGSYEVAVIVSAVASRPITLTVTPPRAIPSGGCSHGGANGGLLLAVGAAAAAAAARRRDAAESRRLLRRDADAPSRAEPGLERTHLRRPGSPGPAQPRPEAGRVRALGRERGGTNT